MKMVKDGDLRWSKDMQGIAHGSIFCGYIASQVIGGVLSIHFGGRTVLGLAMLLASLTKLATPTAARHYFGAFVGLRVVLGLCCGVIYPAGYTILSKWVPPAEQNRLMGWTLAGAPAGTVIALFFGGYLCQHGFAQGWPSIFYAFGISGLIWCLLWIILVTDSPHTNRWISQQERNYIEQNLKGAIGKKKVPRVPWRNIFSSVPVWVTIITHVCFNCLGYTVLTQLPTYLREVFGFTNTENGLLSAIPYILEILLLFLFSHVADALTTKKILTRSGSRKLFTGLGFLPVAVLALIVTVLPCSLKAIAISILIIGIGCSGCNKLGFLLTPTDLAPQFSGVVFAISNTAATVPGIVMPMVVAAMTPQRSRIQWNKVFYLNAAISLMGAFIFIFFSSADLQEWARPNEEKEEDENENQALKEDAIDEEAVV